MEGFAQGLDGCDVRFLPIVSAFVMRIGLIEEGNRLCPSEADLSPGLMVWALILDTLGGRNPLYRLEISFRNMDVELLLEKGVCASTLNDDAAGRLLDKLAEVGTGKIMAAVALRVVKLFNLDTSHVHHDATSKTVYGDYEIYNNPGDSHPFVITYGLSKDHRPDLKQLVHSLLSVDREIPIYSKYENGNESDKTVNRNLPAQIVDRMRELGEKDPLYVADSAMVTPDNLEILNDKDKGCRFVSCLPESYKVCKSVIAQAVSANNWQDLGSFSDVSEDSKNKPAHYQCYETSVALYDRSYRALVVHSDAHDKRKTKALTKLLESDKEALSKIKTELERIEFACLPDAQAAADRVSKGRFHELAISVESQEEYAKGRPKADGSRARKGTIFKLNARIEPNSEAIAKAERETGGFVLISNTSAEGEQAIPARELLKIYKDQHHIERNFAFFKDPAIVNSLFLKTPSRIEALGLVIVPALLVWRLMDRTMRIAIEQEGSKITGWNKRPTNRPTSFMMSTFFEHVLVIRMGEQRIVVHKFTDSQLGYLRLLGLSPKIFIVLSSP